jgi:cystathionine beta-lyase/cystathionine gamma-synthase
MALLTEKDLIYTTPEDICAHLGDDYARFEGSVSTPIFQTSLFVRHTPENGVPESDNVYTRVSNPTIETAERKIAALEGGDGALCFGSGMAAISAAILHLVRAGSHVVMVGTAYGPTRALVNDYLGKRFGVTMTAVGGDDLAEIEAAIDRALA